jgi:hypothetical protein
MKNGHFWTSNDRRRGESPRDLNRFYDIRVTDQQVVQNETAIDWYITAKKP